MIRGIHHAAISTPDLDRSLGFYRDLLGFETVLEFEWDPGSEAATKVMAIGPSAGRVALLRSDSGLLELFEFAQPEARPRPEDWRVSDLGLTHLCLEVDDVESEYRRLRAAGVPFHCAPQPVGAGMRATYGRDPDGNVVEILEVPGAGHICGLQAVPPPTRPTPGD